MLITIFGDVHGNLIALEKLFELENSKTDIFVCHGDVLNYGPWSNECVQYLAGIPNCSILKGNHENYFTNGFYEGQNVIAKAFFEFCYSKFDKSLLNTIEDYQNQIRIESFTIQHTIYDQYIFADTDISKIIGHSHQQFVREKNEFKIYNTGSLGQNRQYINQSCYLKLDTTTKNIELKSFVHDISKVINQMKSEKYPAICIDYYLSKKHT